MQLKRRSLAEAMQYLLKDKEQLTTSDLVQIAALANGHIEPNGKYVLTLSENKIR
jgi:hypothetical protein